MTTTTQAPIDVVPSARHAFEPEFTGHPPRPISDRLSEGPYAQGRRRAGIALAVAAAAGLVLSKAPGIDVLARYVLPLGYLTWVSLGALLLAAVSYLPLALRRGPFLYVRDGLPLAVRVLDVVKTPTAIVNGAPSAYAFVATVGFRHPDTAEATAAQVKSDDFSAMRKDAYEVPFKVGDDVTAVYLPGRLEKTLRLYAFLQLSPEVNLRPRSKRTTTDSPLKTALLLLAIPAFFLVLLANVYAFGRYHPVALDYRRIALPMVVGGLVLGGGLFAGLYLAHRSEQRRIRERSLEALASGAAVEVGTPFLGQGAYAWFLRVILAVGAPFLGALTTMCWCFMANAWLDRSAPRSVPATVVEMTMTTHAFIFREYELEYRLEGSSDEHRLLTTPEHLAQLAGRDVAARVRQGRFGWPWVEMVTPR